MPARSDRHTFHELQLLLCMRGRITEKTQDPDASKSPNDFPIASTHTNLQTRNFRETSISRQNTPCYWLKAEFEGQLNRTRSADLIEGVKTTIPSVASAPRTT